MADGIIQKVARTARRFLSAPFEILPAEYGNTVPPDLRMFEIRAEASQREVRQKIAVPVVHGRRSRPARRDESLERQ